MEPSAVSSCDESPVRCFLRVGSLERLKEEVVGEGEGATGGVARMERVSEIKVKFESRIELVG